MSIKFILLIVATIAVLIVVPVMMVLSMVAQLRQKGSERKGGGGISSGVAGAMMELDRFTRPSVEHHIQAEKQILKREDDHGGH